MLETFPEYAFIPGGPWPHPGHAGGAGASDAGLLGRGVRLFNAGYYWEAHEAWETLWHRYGRKGPEADVLKALIKLAAAGVKVRQRQPHGVETHALRARAMFDQVRDQSGPTILGFDLERLSLFASRVAAVPPADPGTPEDRVVVVFDEKIA